MGRLLESGCLISHFRHNTRRLYLPNIETVDLIAPKSFQPSVCLTMSDTDRTIGHVRTSLTSFLLLSLPILRCCEPSTAHYNTKQISWSRVGQNPIRSPEPTNLSVYTFILHARCGNILFRQITQNFEFVPHR